MFIIYYLFIITEYYYYYYYYSSSSSSSSFLSPSPSPSLNHLVAVLDLFVFISVFFIVTRSQSIRSLPSFPSSTSLSLTLPYLTL